MYLAPPAIFYLMFIFLVANDAGKLGLRSIVTGESGLIFTGPIVNYYCRNFIIIHCDLLLQPGNIKP